VYITRIVLTSKGQRQARDIRAIHQTVGYLTDASTGRVLWCLPRRDLLIVQADHPCDVRLTPGLAVSSAHAEVCTDWAAGQRVLVSLIAVPEVAVSRPGRQRSVRRPLTVDDWPGWLERRLAGALTLDDIQVEPMGARIGRKAGTRIIVDWVGYAAAGTVMDPATLAALQRDGVGPHKAYGAGLLLVTTDSKARAA
jgi:hypothetical protein